MRSAEIKAISISYKTRGTAEKRLYITPEAQSNTCWIKCCENGSSIGLLYLILPD